MIAMSVRAMLRTATADIHEALHGAAPFSRIANGTTDRQSYGELLQFLHQYHAAMTPVCAIGAAALGAPELHLAQAARVEALTEDLRVFGLTPDAVNGVSIDGPSFAAGCLYTVQGSTLGGKVIHRQLDYLLPDDDGRNFFRGTPQDGARWQTLCSALESAELDHAQLESGARHAFRLFQTLLEA